MEESETSERLPSVPMRVTPLSGSFLARLNEVKEIVASDVSSTLSEKIGEKKCDIHREDYHEFRPCHNRIATACSAIAILGIACQS